MSIAPFGEADGKKVQEIRLRSAAGAEASIISFGASLRDFVVPLANGQKRRVVLGYETVDGYRTGHASIGATCAKLVWTSIFSCGVISIIFLWDGFTSQSRPPSGPRAVPPGTPRV